MKNKPKNSPITCSTFTSHNSNSSNLNRFTDDETRSTNSTTDNQYTIPKTMAQEIRIIIEKTKNNKAPEIDLINGKILKNLPPKAIRLVTIIFNAISRSSLEKSLPTQLQPQLH